MTNCGFSFFIAFFCALSIAQAADEKKIIAISGDSCQGLFIGAFLIFMVVFGLKMLLGIQITDISEESREK